MLKDELCFILERIQGWIDTCKTSLKRNHNHIKREK